MTTTRRSPRLVCSRTSVRVRQALTRLALCSLEQAGLGSIYPGNKSNFAPRFGFSYQPAQKMVVRGTYGIFFDAINFNGFFDNRPGNGGAVGVQAESDWRDAGAECEPQLLPVEDGSRSVYHGDRVADGIWAGYDQSLASVRHTFRTSI